MSERTQSLKQRVGYKGSAVRRFEAVCDSQEKAMPLADHEEGLQICLDRARLITESYKATEGEPEPIRRAKALAHILRNMTVYIDDGELIVGNAASNNHAVQLYPELSVGWLDRAFGDAYRDMLDDKGRKEWAGICQYWRGKNMSDRLHAILPEHLKDFAQWNPMGWAHNHEAEKPTEIQDIEKLFKVGLSGIVSEVKARLSALESDTVPAPEYINQRTNLTAMLIALEGAIDFGRRYAAKARELASSEKDKKRKEELGEIAEVCEWVPANPPRTLHEAIQSFYFCSLISKQIETCGQGYGNRFDVLMNPYYQKNKAEGRITREAAQELVECLYVKSAEWGYLRPPGSRVTGAGESVVKDLMIGGITPEGEDATNEFSFIMLDASQSIHLPEPTIGFRYHPKVSPALVSKALDVVRTGVGYPAFYNDMAAITWLVKMGVPLEQAKDYGIMACVFPSVPGLNVHSFRPNCGHISLGKCLELALYQGMDKELYTGKQIGVKTPDPRTFTSIDQVTDAFMSQVRLVVEKLAGVDRTYQVLHRQYMARPFSSTLIRGCIERGEDSSQWHNAWVYVFMAGATNAINSLAAIKKFVFEDKTISMNELIEACRTNFAGKEDLRQKLINAPKFGNDDDYVDEFAREVQMKVEAEFMKQRDCDGCPYTMDGSIAAGYFGVSKGCGALPDGKKDSEPFADAVISPSAGTDKKGPTAVLKSVGKVPFANYPTLLNQKFLPQYLEGENKEIFAQYLRAWADLGIWHIQFNVVTKEVLLDAQAHPEKYSDLIVRVAGYSAYFIDLPEGVQIDVIRRAEQALT